MSDDGAIKVVVRIRPFNSRELSEEGGGELAFTVKRNASIEVQNPHFKEADVVGGAVDADAGMKTFGFDAVFASDPNGPCYGTQQSMYETVGLPMLENAMNSYNSCLFAYGQTGAGKSHSVVGSYKDPEQKGILPRSMEYLFSMLGKEKDSAQGAFSWNVMASYLEIYNEKLSDLLAEQTSKKAELQVRVHPQHGPSRAGSD